MKKLSTLLLILLSHFCFSQNLVPNWSFEDTVSCPNSYDEVNRAVGWSAYRESPDYFNSCDNPGDVGVPQNIYDYQYAKTGNAYAGFAALAYIGDNVRECLGIELNQSMVIGQRYFASFYVNRVVNNPLGINIALNKLGLRFSTIEYSYSLPVPIDNNSQIYSDSVITDTLNWVKISGSFIADSAYRYLSIGNFFTDSATTYILFDSSAVVSYYFLDDIKVSTDSNFINAINQYNPFNLITVFPNPARDWISIGGNDVQSLMLYDVLGRIVYITSSVFISPIKINTSTFPRGMYFLKMQTETKSICEKIILQ